MSSLYSSDHEKQFLSAVIRSEGAILAECPQITEADFNPDTNRPVFRAISQCISNNGTVNRFTPRHACSPQMMPIRRKAKYSSTRSISVASQVA